MATGPDRADVAGAFMALVGVCVMMYWPRSLGRAEKSGMKIQAVQSGTVRVSLRRSWFCDQRAVTR